VVPPILRRILVIRIAEAATIAATTCSCHVGLSWAAVWQQHRLDLVERLLFLRRPGRGIVTKGPQEVLRTLPRLTALAEGRHSCGAGQVLVRAEPRAPSRDALTAGWH
jgi:hypothetical protein